jgi:transcriptional regulator with GAF, ATPase, and Fis domain
MSQEYESFVPLGNIILSEESFDAVLQHVVDVACGSVGGCSMAGITLLDRKGPTTAVASSEIALEIDAIQYSEGGGPCLDAYRRQVVNRIDSTATDERWPQFSRGAAANGVHSTLSFPLIVGGDGLGALNLYSDVESGFDEIAERTGAVFANHASTTLANARAYWANEDLRRNLEMALETRASIDQAKGVLMARGGVGADEAFEILRKASQRTNRKLHDIAQEIVDSASRQPSG